MFHGLCGVVGLWFTLLKGSSNLRGYRMSWQDRNTCTVIITRDQSTKPCQAFSIFWLVSEISASKVWVARNVRDMLWKWSPREKYFKYQNFLKRFCSSLFQECFGQILRKSFKYTCPINSIEQPSLVGFIGSWPLVTEKVAKLYIYFYIFCYIYI